MVSLSMVEVRTLCGVLLVTHSVISRGRHEEHTYMRMFWAAVASLLSRLSKCSGGNVSQPEGWGMALMKSDKPEYMHKKDFKYWCHCAAADMGYSGSVSSWWPWFNTAAQGGWLGSSEVIVYSLGGANTTHTPFESKRPRCSSDGLLYHSFIFRL